MGLLNTLQQKKLKNICSILGKMHKPEVGLGNAKNRYYAIWWLQMCLNNISDHRTNYGLSFEYGFDHDLKGNRVVNHVVKNEFS